MGGVDLQDLLMGRFQQLLSEAVISIEQRLFVEMCNDNTPAYSKLLLFAIDAFLHFKPGIPALKGRDSVERYKTAVTKRPNAPEHRAKLMHQLGILDRIELLNSNFPGFLPDVEGFFDKVGLFQKISRDS